MRKFRYRYPITLSCIKYLTTANSVYHFFETFLELGVLCGVNYRVQSRSCMNKPNCYVINPVINLILKVKRHQNEPRKIGDKECPEHHKQNPHKLNIAFCECFVRIAKIFSTFVNFGEYFVARECHNRKSGRQERDCFVPLDCSVI